SEDRMSAMPGSNLACAPPAATTAGAAFATSRTSRGDLIAPAWVLVAGDFHRAGGMDRANAELASYLCAAGVAVHLVSYRVDPKLAAQPNVGVHLARRTAGSHFLGQR